VVWFYPVDGEGGDAALTAEPKRTESRKLAKAHMFNGINLPTVYARTPTGEFVLKRRFAYEDFASRCGMAHA